MDTTGFSQVGRFGTLSLLKRRTSSGGEQANEVITSFGIDTNDFTFGSASTCGVRLYYPDVDALHCKITFDQHQAHLVVYGSEGVYIDGTWVYPGATHALSDNAEFEIHSKRFRFTYPPMDEDTYRMNMVFAIGGMPPMRDLPVHLPGTPAPGTKNTRTLRLSMIHSAQVFSPRPSKDPRENLRTLQSPLKAVFGTKTPVRPTQHRPRAVSPLKFGVSRPESDEEDEDEPTAHEEEEDIPSDEDEEDQEQIVLVETNHPRVVEEERDLVILEDVPASDAPPPVPLPPSSPARSLQQVKSQPRPHPQLSVATTSAAPAAPPRTPRRKSLGGTALHRAVLIRSAQRAVWRAEKEREEEEEEMEVLDAVADARDDDDDDEQVDEWEDHDVEMREVSSDESEADPEPEHGEEEAEDEDQHAPATGEQKSLWRRSVESIIPWKFGSGSAAVQDDDDDDEDDDEDEALVDGPEDSQSQERPTVDDGGRGDEEEEEEDEEPAPLPQPAQTPIRRVFGSFMTPQPQPQQAARRTLFPQTQGRPTMGPPALPHATPGAGRLSLGGGEARRVAASIQQPWRMKDLVVPPMQESGGSSSSSATPKPAPSTPSQLHATPAARPPATPVRATPVVTAEERAAIQERRRSAAREYKADGFWKDGAPGMSPVKNGERVARSSVSPTKGSMSPTKGRALGYAISEDEEGADATPAAESTRYDEDEDEPEDSQTMLERMRETVESLKRRPSVMATPRAGAATPAGSLAVPSSVALATPTRTVSGSSSSHTLGGVSKIDFSGVTPAKAAAEEEEPFSLLRTPLTRRLVHVGTGSRTGARKGQERHYSVEAVVAGEGEDSYDSAEDDDEEVVVPKARGKTRAMPRAPTPKPLPEPEVVDEEEEEAVVEPAPRKAAAKSTPKPRSRNAKSPAPKAVAEATTVDEEEEEDVVEPEVVEEEAVVEPAPRKAVAKARSRSAKSPAPPAVAEATPAAATLAPTKPRSRTAKSPAPAAVADATPAAPTKPRSRTAAAVGEAGTLVPPPRRGRSRSKTPQPVQVEDESDEEEEEESPPKPVPGKRTRRGTAEPEESAAPVRRGRKATVEPEEEEAPKTTRIPRGRKQAAPVVEEEEEEQVAAPKRSRSRKAVADEQTASGSKPKSSIPVRGRKKAVVEEEEEPAPAPIARGRGAKSSIAVAARPKPAASLARTPVAATESKLAKPRGRPKTPATAPAASSSTLPAAKSEKENTPGDTASDEPEEQTVKVRVSRKTTAAATAAATPAARASRIAKSATTTRSKVVKVEDTEEPDEPPPPRATRIMRARTKTG